jgi:hypothetical protein
MAEKQVKQLQKVLARESKLDEQKLQLAKAELEKAEKAYHNSVKVEYIISVPCSKLTVLYRRSIKHRKYLKKQARTRSKRRAS